MTPHENSTPEAQIKICYSCKNPKSISDFGNDKNAKDGHRGSCRDCRRKKRNPLVNRASVKRYKQKNKARLLEYNRNHPEWNKNRPWISKALSKCKERASKKGLPFNITGEDLLDPRTRTLPEFCPIFPHIRLDYSAGTDRRVWASVDKIVPELGYVKGNVCVMSFSANFWKSNGSSDAERARIIEIMTGIRP